MMTIAEAQRHGHNTLRKAGIESLRLDTTLLLEKATGKPRAWLFAHPEAELAEKPAHTFMELVNRRRQRIPLAHLTNKLEFYGLDFYIDERVLQPRVETEKIVEYALHYAPQGSRLIDVGTGSGAIAIAIKKHRPDLEVWATDVSTAALEVAAINAKNLDAKIRILASDLWDRVDGSYATVVTNLPYLRNDAELMPEVSNEPEIALFGGSDGLELYRRFLGQLANHLRPRGYLFTECDPWQHEELITSAKNVGLALIESNNYFVLGFQRD